MKLREWQESCLNQALTHYSQGLAHFMCLATPGAGKTHLASVLAANLLATDEVDLVICCAPSVIVAEDFKEALARQTGARFDGCLGSRGVAMTYQSMLHQSDTFWSLFRERRIFVIFDEIHHCAGQSLEEANAWGAQLIAHIQHQATFTLALSGTPWRSDLRPIALACYDDDRIHCHYRYGLNRAIEDGVCRTPKITLIDNSFITVHRDGKQHQYRGLKALLDDDGCRYEELLRSEALITYCLSLCVKQLDQLRRKDGSAGGLIVASSVEHAKQIALILEREFNEYADIATYQEFDPLGVIRDFTNSKRKWIISVGMISEGTNVPRLRVCCHLTRVKTELYFRQVLGRILRIYGPNEQIAYFYMPAEPTLVEYAERLIEDIPNSDPIKYSIASDPLALSGGGNSTVPLEDVQELTHKDACRSIDLQFSESDTTEKAGNPSLLSISYDSCIQWSNRFRSQILAINGLC